MKSPQYFYQKILEKDFNDAETLNALALYYDLDNRPYVGLLCKLVSLLVNPNQTNIFREAIDAYESCILNPATIHYSTGPIVQISVIVSTLNRPRTLKVALESILKQSFWDYEIIVVNNGGSSDAKDVVDSFNSNKIRYLYEPRAGQYVATNTALKEARGNYITYLDDDDILYPKHLETLYDAARVRDADILYGRNRWVVGKWIGDQWIELEDLTKHEPYDSSRLYGACLVANQNVIHSRSLIEKIGLYQDQSERGSDWEFHVRCSRVYNVERISQVTSEVRVPGILPASQPLRAQFYSQLWPLYFRSGFGEVILGIAAWANGDMLYGWEHIEKINEWKNMNKRSLDALWNYLLQKNINTKRSDYLWDQLARYQSVWLTNKVATHPAALLQIDPKFVKQASLKAFGQLVFKPKNLVS